MLAQLCLESFIKNIVKWFLSSNWEKTLDESTASIVNLMDDESLLFLEVRFRNNRFTMILR